MANLLIVSDPDPGRRARCLEAAAGRLEILPGLAAGRLEAGSLVAAWRAGPRAPVSVAEPGEGAPRGAGAGGDGRPADDADRLPAAAIWGDALPAGREGRLSARGLLERLGAVPGAGEGGPSVGAEGGRPPAGEAAPPAGEGGPPAFDGFHAWMARDGGGTLRLGADPLGLFPLYWARPRPDVLVAGTSPAVLAAHPLLEPAPDLRGLAAVFLTNGLVGGRTVLAGVRRLAPGHVLRWRPGDEAEEVEAYRPAPSHDLCDAPLEVLLRRVDGAVEDAVRRLAAPWDAGAVMLSGGKDSRLLAGYARRVGGRWSAVTLGRARDLEFRCAAAVADVLGLEHRRLEHRPGDVERGARLEARAACLSNGFSGPQGWTLPLRVRPGEPGAGDGSRPAARGPGGAAAGTEALLPPALLLGHIGNSVLSLSGVLHAVDPDADPPFSARRMLRHRNRWGIPLPVLRAAARPRFREEGVEPAAAGLERAMLPEADVPARRVWLSDLRHRQRFHVGSSAWRLSFVAWPLLPVDDRRLLDLMASTPLAVHHERRLHVDLMIREFPELARQPLDRNSFDTRPLLPRTRHHVATAIRQRLAGSAAGRWWRRLRAERRYYYRLYDLDSEGWRAVRRAAEPARGHLSGLFDVERLTRTYLPLPDAPVPTDDAIMDAAGRKLLLGWMLLGGELPALVEGRGGPAGD